MAEFGNKSLRKLETCDLQLQRGFSRVVKIIDCTVICGARGEEKQNRYYGEGNSLVEWPHSKHNVVIEGAKSRAIDVIPWYALEKPHTDWSYDNELFGVEHIQAIRNIKRWHEFIGIVKGVFIMMGIPIRCGSDFKTFVDMAHFELI